MTRNHARNLIKFGMCRFSTETFALTKVVLIGFLARIGMFKSFQKYLLRDDKLKINQRISYSYHFIQEFSPDEPAQLSSRSLQNCSERFSNNLRVLSNSIDCSCITVQPPPPRQIPPRLQLRPAREEFIPSWPRVCS